ncbi:hypothetical protein Mzhil_0138 [Methanosalsum zhilinae DSM 4017]|uniref:DUF2953 domain-containing protein n=2 Tax=Methanosalsum zhilinae TaxID=39669 RepID=F7XN61_METZD|nr:hypothetical protein Mzhil_0138 [Methanosalsum zhilinae DSM 4017]
MNLDSVKDGTRIQNHISIKWFLFSYTLNRENTSLKGQKKVSSSESEEQAVSESSHGIKDIEFIFGLIRQLFRPSMRMMVDIFKKITVKTGYFSIRFGFDDPADTGMMCGLMYSAAGIARQISDRCRIKIDPVFDHEVFNYNALFNFQVRIYSIIPAFLRFMFNRDVMSAFWKVLRRQIL